MSSSHTQVGESSSNFWERLVEDSTVSEAADFLNRSATLESSALGVSEEEWSEERALACLAEGFKKYSSPDGSIVGKNLHQCAPEVQIKARKIYIALQKIEDSPLGEIGKKVDVYSYDSIMHARSDIHRVDQLLIVNDSPPMTIAELREQRRASELKGNAIKLQAKLFKAIRSGKVKVADPGFLLDRFGSSKNLVYDLESAFFKNGIATGSMEKLIWDISLILGDEDYFVPTGLTELHPLGGAEPIPLKGGIQIAQKGRTVWQSPSHQREAIPIREISRATLISMVFGMFDAHGNNIFLTEEGELKFFDNAQSLPHSNGFIIWGSRVRPSYCNALLDLPQSRAVLPPEEIGQLKQKVVSYREKMEKIETYLQSIQAKKLLGKVPTGWINLKKSLDAMKERIALIDSVLNSEKPLSVQDLVAESLPHYKFALSLTYLTMLEKEGGPVSSLDPITRPRLHGRINHCDLIHDLPKLAELGYNVQMILDLCNDPENRVVDILNQLAEVYNNKGLRFDKSLMIPIAKTLQDEFDGKSEFDFKDISMKECKEFLIKEIEFELKSKHRALPNLIFALNFISVPTNFPTFFITVGEKHYLVHRTSTGPLAIQCELGSGKGLLKIGSEEVRAKEYIEGINSGAIVPAFDQLPSLDYCKRMGYFTKNTLPLCLLRDVRSGSLVVSIKIEGGNLFLIFVPGSDGKFQDLRTGEELTIQEIRERELAKIGSSS